MFSKLFFAILALGFIVQPLVFWPSAPVAYEIPRVWFVLVWIDVLFILTFVKSLRNTENTVYNRELIGSIVLFGSIALLASVFGIDPMHSVFGNYWRRDGLVTLFHLFALSYIVNGVWRRYRHALIMSISLGSLAVSAWAVTDGYRFFLLGDRSVRDFQGAIGASFGQPQFLAGFLVVTLPFVWYLLTATRSTAVRSIILVSGFVQIVAILLTKSSGGMIGIVVFFIGILIPKFSKVKILAPLFTILGILGITVLIATYIQFVRSIPPQLLAESRPRIFMKGFLGWAERPVLGWGWANFNNAFSAADWPYHFEYDAYVDKAHAHILEVLATTGAIGLASYTIMLYLIGRQLWRNSRQGSHSQRLVYQSLFLSFILYVMHSQTNVTSIAEELIFWFIVGASISTAGADSNVDIS